MKPVTTALTAALHAGLALDLSKRIEFALDIARGMACLHAQRPIIIHRDLKTANLLVSARFEIKVADFGLSRIKDASHVSNSAQPTRSMYCYSLHVHVMTHHMPAMALAH